MLWVLFMVVVVVVVGWFAFKTGKQNGMQIAAVATSQVKDETLALAVANGKAKQIPITTKMTTSLKAVLAGFVGTTGLPNAYMYYCRGNDGSAFLYQTQVNLGTSYQSQSSTCVQVQE